MEGRKEINKQKKGRHILKGMKKKGRRHIGRKAFGRQKD
jgi:hypothetical protein